jgi:hypothetical protein
MHQGSAFQPQALAQRPGLESLKKGTFSMVIMKLILINETNSISRNAQIKSAIAPARTITKQNLYQLFIKPLQHGSATR